jgi:hypothetical protein
MPSAITWVNVEFGCAALRDEMRRSGELQNIQEFYGASAVEKAEPRVIDGTDSPQTNRQDYRMRECGARSASSRQKSSFGQKSRSDLYLGGSRGGLGILECVVH